MIRLLPQNLINQIAAGEVVERPAAALKELIENAIDAGGTKIDIKMTDGGKTYFSVTDNGKGMTPEELSLSVERHATSKLPNDDLFNINFLGFRGEALPSIASVARVKITSRPKEASEGWSLSIEGGQKDAPRPAAHGFGTTVEVRDLFFATPARLKFLKSAQSEMMAAKDIINRLAMAYPGISFSLSDDRRVILSYPAVDTLLKRVGAVIGKAFEENVVPIQTAYEDIELSGFVGLPTYVRATSSEQYLFVNGRCIRDKVLTGAVRGAYQGLIGHDAYPVVVLFLKVPNTDVDVNVHPAKTEVRFKDTARIKGLLVGSIRNALSEQGNKTATTIAIGALDKAAVPVIPHPIPLPHRQSTYRGSSRPYFTPPMERRIEPVPLGLVSSAEEPVMELRDSFSVKAESVSVPAQKEKTAQSAVPVSEEIFPPLGLAKAQVHKTYIIAQAKEGIVIVDQHAAHERLTYEKLIKTVGNHPQTQIMLIPEVIEMTADEVRLLSHRSDELKEFGLVLDVFGHDCIAVREIPALLDKADLKKMVQDLADTLKEFGDTVLLKDRIKDVCARMACHGSIRAGRVLSIEEMNALLRQMEACGTSGQCIHGRPTYIELKLTDIEKLFGRRG